jgi:hypothetical protein
MSDDITALTLPSGERARRLRSVHARLSVPTPDALRRDAGTLSMAVYPLEDWVTAAPRPTHFKHLPHGYHRLLLSDSPDGDPATAFALNWDQGWHPQFYVKWARGRFYPDLLAPVQRPFALCGHFSFQRLRWHHLLATWDHPRRRLRLYVNGVRVAAEDRFFDLYSDEWRPDPPGDTLYYGGQDHYATDPQFTDAFSEDGDAEAAFAQFAAQLPDAACPDELRSLHAGLPRRATPPPADDYPAGRFYPLTSPDDLNDVYRQGCADAARITADGLEIRTPKYNPPHRVVEGDANEGHLYLWFPEYAEGDLRLEYEFQILERGGLSLFIAQAAGIQGERFMEDYPRRTTGAMRMVCWEDVRNYHLEYYREMNDVRNDVATFALMKNPWLRVLGFATRREPLALDRWYRLCFVQDAERLRLFIDDDLVIDARDSPHSNNGPLLQRGCVALRCMLRTAMRFRNLSIRWRP